MGSTARGSRIPTSSRWPARSSIGSSGRARTRRTLPAWETSRRPLLDVTVPGGRVTEAGVRQDISVAVRYLDAWLRGNGAAALDNLMEDAATAEISRSQLWQWRRHATPLEDGVPFTADRYRRIRDDELDRIGRDTGRVAESAALLDDLVLAHDFAEFLTLEAYGRLD